MSLTIINLPDDIIYYISLFLTQNEIRNIFNTTKVFSQFKKNYVYWNFTKEKSADINLPNLFDNLVSNSYKQISVNLNSNLSYDFSNLYKLNNIHTLNLSNTPIKNINVLINVHTLDLTNTRVRNVKALSNVHTLTLNIGPIFNIFCIIKYTYIDINK